MNPTSKISSRKAVFVDNCVGFSRLIESCVFRSDLREEKDGKSHDRWIGIWWFEGQGEAALIGWDVVYLCEIYFSEGVFFLEKKSLVCMWMKENLHQVPMSGSRKLLDFFGSSKFKSIALSRKAVNIFNAVYIYVYPNRDILTSPKHLYAPEN